MLFKNLSSKTIKFREFSDALEKCYAAIANLRVMKKKDKIKVNLPLTKSKVALLNNVSLLKLE